MALNITLKPYERMIIGGAVVTNGKNRADLMVENKTSILREKDIMTEEKADSHCRRIYLTVQLMYIDPGNLTTYHTLYWQLVRELADAAPHTVGLVDQISEHILTSSYYQALKLTRKLIDYEQEVIAGVYECVECL